MKKSVSLMICLALVFMLCACGSSDAGKETDVENAMTETEEEVFEPITTDFPSLQDLNDRIGMSLCHPAVMGITDLGFSETEYEDHIVGEYCFEAYGLEYVFRGCPVGGVDITGINPAPFRAEISDETEYAEVDGVKMARWFNIDGQYVLMVKDEGAMESDTFEAIADELVKLTSPGWQEEDYITYYSFLEGNYYDSNSQRAVAQAVANGADSLILTITWANSAAETCEWKMNLRRAEDGLLYYTDCVKTVITYSDAEDEESVTENSESENEETVENTVIENRTVEYENGSGFFGETEGVLFWNGAEEESCRECVFGK